MAPNHEELKAHIRKHYANLFDRERLWRLPIETGKNLAKTLGYPLDVLENPIPEKYWDWFVPCGNPLPYLELSTGDRVLNLGCGAAIDSFVLAARHGTAVEIVSLDITFKALKRAERQAVRLNLDRKGILHWVCADGERLPFGTECFDWLIMNGVFNLFPHKGGILEEIHRVLKPGGTVVGADLCSSGPLPEYFHEELDAWAWCMNGACTEEELTALFVTAGFDRIRLVRKEAEDLFYRIVFCCRKGSRALQE